MEKIVEKQVNNPIKWSCVRYLYVGNKVGIQDHPEISLPLNYYNNKVKYYDNKISSRKDIIKALEENREAIHISKEKIKLGFLGEHLHIPYLEDGGYFIFWYDERSYLGMADETTKHRLIVYLTEGTVRNYFEETPAAKELNDRFDIEKYYKEYLTKLDERFIPWDELHWAGGDCHFPTFRDYLGVAVPESIGYSVILSKEPMSKVWYIQENVSFIGNRYGLRIEDEVVIVHKIVNFHRIITKLFKGKELSVDEAVAELKEIVGGK